MRQGRNLGAVLVLLALLLLAGCGGAPKPRTVKLCSGLTDTCHVVAVPQLGKLARLVRVAGCRIPDVSDYQGYIDWARVKPYVCGGITKAGEGGGYNGARSFTHNWTQMASLGMWHSAYWFVRGSASCATQAGLIIARLGSVGYGHDPRAGNFQLDDEVPHANDGNLALCIAGRIFAAFHRLADIYTGPGTWPGGSHGSLALWQAEYGPRLHPFWTPVVAWQCTDGALGCVTYVPGIGYGDVSVDLGITREHYAPPDPYAIFPKAVYRLAHGVKAAEHGTVGTWYANGCKDPAVRPVCKSSHYHAQLLRDREWFVVHRTPDLRHALRHARWADNHLGERFQALSRIIG